MEIIGPETPSAMTIAGSDSGGGAGIQADLRAFAANGCFGTSVITCLTAQNPKGVTDIAPMTGDFVQAQIDQIISWLQIKAIKTGMLLNDEIIGVVAKLISSPNCPPVVVDPVMVATSGAVLLEDDAIDRLKKEILPKATLVTPNLDEAAVLNGERPNTLEEMRSTAHKLVKEYNVPFLLKGGHLTGKTVTDILIDCSGKETVFEKERYLQLNTHGSGCTLSSAIAANLARGKDLTTSVGEALEYVHESMRKPLHLNGTAYINHFPE